MFTYSPQEKIIVEQLKSFRSHKFLDFPALFLIMTVLFWDPYIHTEDNWGTRMQLLQKFQMLTDAPEGNIMHLEPGVKTLDRIKMCTFSTHDDIYIYIYSTALQKLQKALACFPEDSCGSFRTQY